MNFDSYQAGDFYDELFRDDETPREEFRLLVERINSLPEGELLRRQRVAERDLMHMGITFNVYGDERGRERIFPFDLVPRLVTSQEWDWLERGLQQRVRALNLFIDDVYHDQRIVKDRIIPEEVIRSAQGFQEACIGLDPPQGVWCHITGTDIVRDSDGRIYVLEDNLRVPSGVSYVLQNRLVLKRTFPEVFQGLGVRPVDDYPGRLLGMLEDVAPSGRTRAEVYLPGGGWRGYDPTYGLAVADRHIAVAASATPRLAGPLSGSFRGSGVTSTMEAEISLDATESKAGPAPGVVEG